MYLASNIKLNIDFNKDNLSTIISNKFKLNKDLICDIKLQKLSLDARNKSDIKYIASISFDYKKSLSISKFKNLTIFKEIKSIPIIANNFNKKVIIVGSGPSGLFSALEFLRSGVKVTILERGYEMSKRQKAVDNLFTNGILDEKSNIQFGEGGAGTFSDGKLNSGIKSEFVSYVLNTFHKFGAGENICYDFRPHVGTDVLSKVIVNIRNYLIENGCEVLFEHRVKEIKISGDKVTGVIVETPNGDVSMACDILLMGIGHSSRDTIRMLYDKGLEIKQKPFSMGVRIEHLAKDINFAQYGEIAHKNILPTADYHLSEKLENGRVVYTFCMCPGGVVVPAMSESGTIVTNGMSYNARDGVNSNSAVLVNVNVEDFESSHPLAGIEFQEMYEKKAFKNGCPTVQTFEDFLNGVPSKKLGKVVPSIKPKYVLGDVSEMLPHFVVTSLKDGILKLNKKLKCFADGDSILTGIESRSSAPYQVKRDEKMQTSISGLYMIGEGAGFAGGIVSSAVDGIKVSRQILNENN